jgi:hypothetical protein
VRAQPREDEDDGSVPRIALRAATGRFGRGDAPPTGLSAITFATISDASLMMEPGGRSR